MRFDETIALAADRAYIAINIVCPPPVTAHFLSNISDAQNIKKAQIDPIHLTYLLRIYVFRSTHDLIVTHSLEI